mmetsp:Transcript_7798/g.25548  ORF Transcript_7798/g.25548 Transcript_7798/m.25548 type:complete len:525 (+) Transcript_7798:462-2036(+)
MKKRASGRGRVEAAASASQGAHSGVRQPVGRRRRRRAQQLLRHELDGRRDVELHRAVDGAVEEGAEAVPLDEEAARLRLGAAARRRGAARRVGAERRVERAEQRLLGQQRLLGRQLVAARSEELGQLREERGGLLLVGVRRRGRRGRVRRRAVEDAEARRAAVRRPPSRGRTGGVAERAEREGGGGGGAGREAGARRRGRAEQVLGLQRAHRLPVGAQRLKAVVEGVCARRRHRGARLVVLVRVGAAAARAAVGGRPRAGGDADRDAVPLRPGHRQPRGRERRQAGARPQLDGVQRPAGGGAARVEVEEGGEAADVGLEVEHVERPARRAAARPLLDRRDELRQGERARARSEQGVDQRRHRAGADEAGGPLARGAVLAPRAEAVDDDRREQLLAMLLRRARLRVVDVVRERGRPVVVVVVVVRLGECGGPRVVRGVRTRHAPVAQRPRHRRRRGVEAGDLDRRRRLGGRREVVLRRRGRRRRGRKRGREDSAPGRGGAPEDVRAERREGRLRVATAEHRCERR